MDAATVTTAQAERVSSLASVLLVLGAVGGFASWTSRALPGSTAAVTAAVGG